MARRLRILLPPSEGKAPGGSGPPWSPGTGLAADRLDARRSQVLGHVGDDVARHPTMAAIERYTGVLYRELDWASLGATERRRGRAAIRIVSGLWGLVAPADPIPDYRLKMSAAAPGAGPGRLSSWWRPALTEVLTTDLRGAHVWDLLPNEHAAAWSPDEIAMRHHVTVRFVDRDDRTVSHWNKLLKGALVRLLLSEGALDPADLVDWAHPAGYRLDPLASDLGERRSRLVLRET